MVFHTIGLIAVFGLLAVFPGSAALAQDNEKRGFDAESVYDVGEIDTVSLFAGGLSLVIPIGNEYPVNANFSYGLSLFEALTAPTKGDSR